MQQRLLMVRAEEGMRRRRRQWVDVHETPLTRLRVSLCGAVCAVRCFRCLSSTSISTPNPQLLWGGAEAQVRTGLMEGSVPCS